MIKYHIPEFLVGIKSDEQYRTWLDKKATSQYKRDKDFYNKHNKNFPYERINYKETIHEAVLNSNGFDCYTGKKLDWHLISTWNNKDAHKELAYKKKFKNLPTLEHFNREELSEKLEFKICSWAVNDAKNDLTVKEFVELCQDVIAYIVKE